MKIAKILEDAIEAAEQEGYDLEMMITSTKSPSPGSQKRLLKYVKLTKLLRRV